MKVLGLMSGTSLDGVDAAVLETDGIDIFGFGPSLSLPYSEADRRVIRGAFGWEPAPEAAALIDRRHLEAIRALDAAPDLIGYHGQTVAHDPAAGRTRQLGDGETLARASGAPVVWDFRTADMAAGGEGAPLAPFYHWACARRIGARAPMAFLNLGGVGNVTWVDPGADAPDAAEALIAFDTGPANALIDDLVRARTGATFDKGGATAAAGTVKRALVECWLTHTYFGRPAPKSLDRDTFAGAVRDVAALSTVDAAATLAAFTVAAVAAAVERLPASPAAWLVTGGGRKNAFIMNALSDCLEAPVQPVEAAGLDGDMLEAQAFAYLAARCLRGLPLSAPGTTGCDRPVTGGRVARP